MTAKNNHSGTDAADHIPDILVERLALRLESRRSEPTWLRKNRGHMLAAVVVLCFIPVFVVMFRIAFLDTNKGWRTSEAAATASASEAVMQMAQWTITTVFAIGGALIGLNWYQSEKRYEHDRQVFEDRLTEKINSKLGEYEKSLDMVTRASIVSLDMYAAQIIKESVGRRDGSINDLNYVERVIRTFHDAKEPLARRGAARILVEEILHAGSAIPGTPGRLDRAQLAMIEGAAHDLNKEFPDLGQALLGAVRAYEYWHHPAPSAPDQQTDETR
jgi:hypothetical protein